MYEHFLHFRAFIVDNRPFEFDLHQFVDEEYATAASRLLEKGAWEDFNHYRRSVDNSDPDIRILGQFASAKVDQNHVLVDVYGGNGLAHGREEKDFVSGLHEDSEETPSRRAPARFLPMKPDYRSPPGDCDAADEAIVNKAMAGFVSILTRPFTKEFVRAPAALVERRLSRNPRTTPSGRVSQGGLLREIGFTSRSAAGKMTATRHRHLLMRNVNQVST